MGTIDETNSVLTINEIAAILRCSRTHIANLLGGRVPGVAPLVHLTLGRRKVVRRSTFDVWVESSEGFAFNVPPRRTEAARSVSRAQRDRGE